jgi:hypothetical protein
VPPEIFDLVIDRTRSRSANHHDTMLANGPLDGPRRRRGPAEMAFLNTDGDLRAHAWRAERLRELGLTPQPRETKAGGSATAGIRGTSWRLS